MKQVVYDFDDFLTLLREYGMESLMDIRAEVIREFLQPLFVRVILRVYAPTYRGIVIYEESIVALSTETEKIKKWVDEAKERVRKAFNIPKLIMGRWEEEG
jgi:hypothetical protein